MQFAVPVAPLKAPLNMFAAAIISINNTKTPLDSGCSPERVLINTLRFPHAKVPRTQLSTAVRNKKYTKPEHAVGSVEHGELLRTVRTVQSRFN